MSEVAFIFGAGAEGDGNFGLKTGLDYLRASLLGRDDKKVQLALKNYFGEEKYFDEKYSYSKHTLTPDNFILHNLTFQKACSDFEFFKENYSDIDDILSDREMETIFETYKKTDESNSEKLRELDDLKQQDGKNSSKDSIKKEFIAIFKQNREGEFKDIKSPFLRKLFYDKDGKIGYDANISISGLLDSYFHTIINPSKYSDIRFSKIFNYYWNCYFTILEPVLSYLKTSDSSNKYDVYFESDDKEKTDLKCELILGNLGKLTKTIYNVDLNALPTEDTYYGLIREKLRERQDITCGGVVTTNYYRFCELVHDKPIYLNGELRLFEYPELLDVVDIRNEKEHLKNLYFPFIFGQSHTKPIIHPIQIQNFHRFSELLNRLCENNGVLVILGFNMNEDDNHINAFLRDYVMKGGKLIVVTNEENYKISPKLHCSEELENIDRCVVQYPNGENAITNKDIINKVFEHISKMIGGTNDER